MCCVLKDSTNTNTLYATLGTLGKQRCNKEPYLQKQIYHNVYLGHHLYIVAKNNFLFIFAARLFGHVLSGAQYLLLC